MRYISAILVVTAPLLTAACKSHVSEPKQLTDRFYSTLAQHTVGFEGDLDRISPLLSVRLKQLLDEARAANARAEKLSPGNVPPFEHGECEFFGGGDCEFTSYKLIGLDAQEAARAQVTVQLNLVDRNHPANPPETWTNVVALRIEGSRWVVDDVAYFHTRASESLAAIAKAAPQAQQ